MDFTTAKNQVLQSRLGRECPEDHVARLLLAAGSVSASAGRIILTKGAPAEQIFLLLVSGSVTVAETGCKLALVEGSGGLVLGEVGVFNPEGKRTATVVADEDCELLAWKFDQLPKDLQEALTPVLERIAFERISIYSKGP